MKRMQKVLAFVLSLVLLLSLVPFGVSVVAEEEEVKTLKVLGPEGTTGKFKFSERDHYSIWPKFEELMAEYGLDLEFEVVASDQYQTAIQTRMNTATDLPDFANVTALGQATILEMASRGLFQALNPIIDEYSDGTAKEFFGPGGLGERSHLLNTTVDGEVYWISQIQATSYGGNPGSTNILLQIRRDWLDAVGLPVPTTTTEFKDALIAFQENDVNGSGTPDEIISIDLSGFAANGLAEAFGLVYGMVGFNMENGVPTEVTSPWHQEGIKDYFTYLNELYELGLIDPIVIGATEPNQNIENNKAAAVSNYTMATWNEPLVAGVDNAMYEPIGPLVYDGGDAEYPAILAIEPPELSYNNWAFTSVAEDPEANARLLDLLCSETYMELTQWGIEGETFEVDEDGNKHLLPIALHDAYDEAYDAGFVVGDFLWANGSIFPKRRFVPIENEIEQVRVGFPLKSEFQERVMDYPFTTPLGTGNYLPVASNEQLQRQSELSTDLDTLSQEIASNLIFGDYSVDDLDMYVEELNALGLQDLVEITQTRMDRALELGIFSAAETEAE